MPRSLLNSSKNGFAVDETRKPSNKALKFKKPTIATNRKCSSGIKSLDRLVGGADVPEETEDTPIPAKEITEEATSDLKTDNGKSEKTAPSGGPCCFCIPQVPGSTGYNTRFSNLTKYCQF